MKKLFNPILILVLVLVSYANSLWNKFAWDDLAIVKENPLITDWANLPHIFTSAYWASIGKAGGLYRPLTLSSYLVENSISGMNPFLFHLDNVILHFLCSLLVYFIAAHFFKDEWTPLFSGMLFAVHPVHTESVASVVGRGELLSVFFFLAALYTFIKPPKKIPWFVISPLCLLLGLLSKETAITLPAFIAVYLLLFERNGRGKSFYKILAALSPYIFVTAVYLLARYFVLKGSLGPAAEEQMMGNVSSFSFFLLMVKALLYYIRLAVFPTGLLVFYYFLPPGLMSIPVFLMLAFTVLFLATSPSLIKKSPAVFFFILWFFLALFPVSNIIHIGILMSERAMYLPSISFCVVAAYAFSAAMKYSKPLAVSCLAVSVISLSSLTVIRNPVWANEDVLKTELTNVMYNQIEALKSSTIVPIELYTHLADVAVEMKRYDKAEDALKDLIRLAPTQYEAHVRLAELYSVQHKNELAGSELQESLKYRHLFTHRDFGSLARVYFELKRFDESDAFFQKAISMDPGNGTYYFNYAYLLDAKGDKGAALVNLEKAAVLTPTLAENSYYRQGIILGNMNRYSEAVVALNKAAKLNPGNPENHIYLGAAYLGIGQREKALEEAKIAIRIAPDNKDAMELYNSLK